MLSSGMSEKRSSARTRSKECFAWRVVNLVKKVRRELVALPVTKLHAVRSVLYHSRSGRAYIFTGDILVQVQGGNSKNPARSFVFHRRDSEATSEQRGAMASSSIKNWHWRTKSVHSWSQQYFEQHLVGVEAQGVSVQPGVELEGDAEVGMRKSKYFTPLARYRFGSSLRPLQTRHHLRREDYPQMGRYRLDRNNPHRNPRRAVSHPSALSPSLPALSGPFYVELKFSSCNNGN